MPQSLNQPERHRDKREDQAVKRRGFIWEGVSALLLFFSLRLSCLDGHFPLLTSELSLISVENITRRPISPTVKSVKMCNTRCTYGTHMPVHARARCIDGLGTPTKGVREGIYRVLYTTQGVYGRSIASLGHLWDTSGTPLGPPGTAGMPLRDTSGTAGMPLRAKSPVFLHFLQF